MSRYVIAALSMALAVGPAAALDIGAGANVGGVGVNAGVSLGDKGASVGLGASVGGVAGADVGASVGRAPLELAPSPRFALSRRSVFR
jgi:hypothetical protein